MVQPPVTHRTNNRQWTNGKPYTATEGKHRNAQTLARPTYSPGGRDRLRMKRCRAEPSQ